MPNWCDNNLTVTGDTDELKRFVAAITNADESITILKNLVPFPAELEGEEITALGGEVVARVFTDSGYSWCLSNWGTKWADCDTEIIIYADYLMLKYATAWSPAIEGLSQISRLFPTLTFQTDWIEEGMQSMGAACFQDGQESIYDVPESDWPELGQDEDGKEDWQSWQDAVCELREKAIERV
jgi:hypothetical protein